MELGVSIIAFGRHLLSVILRFEDVFYDDDDDGGGGDDDPSAPPPDPHDVQLPTIPPLNLNLDRAMRSAMGRRS